MSLLSIDEDTFKMMLLKKASFGDYDRYCNTYFYYNEWKGMTYSERRSCFVDHVNNASLEKLLNDFTWRILFDDKPSLCNGEIVYHG